MGSDSELLKSLWKTLKPCFKAHPWHGVSIGEDAPRIVNAYVEIVPTDAMKYEVDKISGHLRIDRPQKYSNQVPTLYGFIPQTYCGKRVGAFCSEKTGEAHIEGDGDPMDICVLTEKPIQHGDILLRAIPIGGLRMIDGNQADDKIIAVLHEDGVYGGWTDLQKDCPKILLDRLEHYFLTYKDIPGAEKRNVRIAARYGADEARDAIQRSQQDYQSSFPETAKLFSL